MILTRKMMINEIHQSFNIHVNELKNIKFDKLILLYKKAYFEKFTISNLIEIIKLHEYMHNIKIFSKFYKKNTKENLINIININNIKHYDFENPEILTAFILGGYEGLLQNF